VMTAVMATTALAERALALVARPAVPGRAVAPALAAGVPLEHPADGEAGGHETADNDEKDQGHRIHGHSSSPGAATRAAVA
jgi:hypothetical protein